MGGGWPVPDGLRRLRPEERPVHQVEVDGFWIDCHLVTNAQFRRFIKATGYVTVAEQAPDPAAYPGADRTCWSPGPWSSTASGPVDLRDWRAWWAWVSGANWRSPEGPGRACGRDLHPVVQVFYPDAQAYADWAGRRCPARPNGSTRQAGLEGKVFCWGDEFAPRGRQMALTWRGEFPWRNLLLDRYERTSPVGSFPATARAGRHGRQRLGVDSRLLHPVRPQGRGLLRPHHVPGGDPPPGHQGRQPPVRPQLRLRYRPAARQGEAVDTAPPTSASAASSGRPLAATPPVGAGRGGRPGGRPRRLSC